MKPRMLDLFCCESGAAMGYTLAGFDVYGVDIVAQKRYPFAFHMGDALDVLRRLITGAKITFTRPDGHTEHLGLAGIIVLVVTARKVRWGYRTTVWLRKWGLDYGNLYMRRDDDSRKDIEVKRDILARIQEDYQVILAVDDNPNVVALWNEHRIPTVTWPGWES